MGVNEKGGWGWYRLTHREPAAYFHAGHRPPEGPPANSADPARVGAHLCVNVLPSGDHRDKPYMFENNGGFCKLGFWGETDVQCAVDLARVGADLYVNVSSMQSPRGVTDWGFQSEWLVSGPIRGSTAMR